MIQYLIFGQAANNKSITENYPKFRSSRITTSLRTDYSVFGLSLTILFVATLVCIEMMNLTMECKKYVYVNRKRTIKGTTNLPLNIFRNINIQLYREKTDFFDFRCIYFFFTFAW